MSSDRRKFVGGNWKMNGSRVLINEFSNLVKSNQALKEVQVVIAPPAIFLYLCKQTFDDFCEVAAQNVYHKPLGAYTGEISVPMLSEANIGWAIIGHSERRQYFKETDEDIALKLSALLCANLSAILCVGETVEDRESEQTFSVLRTQLNTVVAKNSGWSSSVWSRVVIAYEPVWAIGTGQVATAEQAQEVHAFIRKWICATLGPDLAESMRIIYGGSVNSKNCKELLQCKDIDGFLVGGASLKPEFMDIIQACASINAESS